MKPITALTRTGNSGQNPQRGAKLVLLLGKSNAATLLAGSRLGTSETNGQRTRFQEGSGSSEQDALQSKKLLVYRPERWEGNDVSIPGSSRRGIWKS